MASISQLFQVVRRIGPVVYARRVSTEVDNDAVLTNAAAMAYAWMFAIFPFFIFLLTLTPHLPDTLRAYARDRIADLLNDSLTKPAADTILANVDQVMSHTQGGLLSFGLVLTLFAASGGMSTTMSALDTAFECEKKRKYLGRRLVAMTLTIFMTICVILIMVLLPVGAGIKAYIDSHYPGVLSDSASLLLTFARYAFSLTIMQCMVGIVYHFGRSERGKMHLFSPGALFSVAGWLLSGFAMRLYLSHFDSYSKTYGTVAGMVIMLLIFYINAVVVLVGAEIDSETEYGYRELSSPYNDNPNSTSRPHA